MNSAISNLRPHCSQIVKLILFFYSGGARFLLFLFSLSFSFPSFFPVSYSCSEPPTISLLSLSLLDVSASLFDETQAGALSQADLYRSGSFFFFLLFDGRFGSGCVGYGFGVLDWRSVVLCGLWVEVLGRFWVID